MNIAEILIWESTNALLLIPVVIGLLMLVRWIRGRPVFTVAFYGFRANTITSFPNGSPPCTGLLTPVLDELFESFEIAFDSTGNDSERISSLFNKTFGVIHQLEVNASTI